MSVITHDLPVHRPEPSSGIPGLRDVLLALSLTALAALALDAAGNDVAAVAMGDPVVTDWKGNSGSLPARP